MNLLTERHGEHVLVLKLNRPATRNAIDSELADAIAAAVAGSERESSVRAVVLTSTDDEFFSAGADIKELAAGRMRFRSGAEGGFAGFVQAVRTKPWIAAVSGQALGGGLELCLACDMVVAGEAARFGLPEVLRGLYAGAGGAFRLPRAIPLAAALQMLLTGQPIDSARAYALGLVNAVVPACDVLGHALRLAADIARASPVAVRETLGIARIAAERNEVELWQLSREIGRRLSQTEDFHEGPRAFADKRPPVWTGR